MPGISQLLDIGASGLAAATANMETVSNNTANASTPGYNVESAAQVALPGSGITAGNGTDVTSIQRAFNQFLYQSVVQATTANQSAQTLATNSQNLAAIFPVSSGGADGLGAAISAFFGAANTLTQDPTSIPDRQSLLGEAQSLSSAFNAAGTQVAQGLSSVNGQISAAVQQVNSLTQQIATLNQQIAQQAPGSSPNALLDQRDQLVQQLGQQLGISVQTDANGAVDVYTTGGAALVNGSTSYQFTATSGSYSGGSVEVNYTPTGQDVTDSLSGGTLGGLVASRAQLVEAQNSVGALAAGVAAAVNGQQSLGLDLNGNLGGPLFTVAGPAVYAAGTNTGNATLTAAITNSDQFTPANFTVTKTAGGFAATDTATGQTTALGNGPTLSLDGMTITVSGTAQNGDSFEIEPTAAAAQTLAVATADPSAIAAASAYVVTPGSVSSSGGSGSGITDNNAGSIQASIGGPATSGGLPAGTPLVPASAFGQTLSIVFTSASDFNVETSTGAILTSGSISATTGGEIAIAYPAEAPASAVETVTLSPGTAVAGDTFTLSPGGTGSNGNITALAGLANQDVVGGQTLTNAYSTLVTTVGNYGQEAQVAATAAQGVLTFAQQNEQSVSGVNLDEEAANLVAYQQAYQASAQTIASAQAMFQSLITSLQAA